MRMPITRWPLAGALALCALSSSDNVTMYPGGGVMQMWSLLPDAACRNPASPCSRYDLMPPAQLDLIMRHCEWSRCYQLSWHKRVQLCSILAKLDYAVGQPLFKPESPDCVDFDASWHRSWLSARRFLYATDAPLDALAQSVAPVVVELVDAYPAPSAIPSKAAAILLMMQHASLASDKPRALMLAAQSFFVSMQLRSYTAQRLIASLDWIVKEANGSTFEGRTALGAAAEMYYLMSNAESPKLLQSIALFKRLYPANSTDDAARMGALYPCNAFSRFKVATALNYSDEQTLSARRLAATLGEMPAESQYCCHLQHLPSKPVWHMDELPTQATSILSEMQRHWRTIRDEAAGWLGEHEGAGGSPFLEKHVHKWRFISFISGNRMSPECMDAPVTCGYIKRLMARGLLATSRSAAKSAVMEPGGHLLRHGAPYNLRVRAHLTLVPAPADEAWLLMRTGERISWPVAGQWQFIDDCFEHEVFNKGNASRIILIVDLWHPAMTEQQRYFYNYTAPPIMT